MKIKKWDIAFIVIGFLVILVLFVAPPQTTPRLPLDDIHKDMNDEKTCTNCHSKEGKMPLPDKHPKKERCLLCHKRK